MVRELKPWTSCPLEAKWFDLIKAGTKRWEFRSEQSPVAQDALRKFNGGRLLLRCTKGRGGETCWKVVDGIKKFASPFDVPPEILQEGQVTERELEARTLGAIVALHLDDPTPEEVEMVDSCIKILTNKNTSQPKRGGRPTDVL